MAVFSNSSVQREDYLNLVKRKKRGTQVIRKAIRKQLQYIRRH